MRSRRPYHMVEMQNTNDVAVVQQACRVLESDLESMPTLRQLADEIGIAPARLHRAFKRIAGVSPRQYGQEQRLAKLKSRLRNGQAVSSAIYDAGFGSSRSVYERARSDFGMTPALYRRGGEGMHIGYTIVNSPLGRLLVGATDAGVSSVCLGESDATLERTLRKEYPAAQIEQGGPHLKRYVEAIIEYLRGQRPHLQLPVDIQATAFRRRVWEALRAIPPGQTRTYKQIATEIGDPNASRAVGQACGANPVALVIPCHRVVRNDGKFGGYRWGEKRKRTLLDQERDSA
ncbi:MAG: methylated-DNA--[protein]-cysteine S-methyltransferase [Candidatus Eremiobacteraeota bacterium]|nr:methylated-DNA--[protein]-cysteine S-methyltransferase [Candidatus Eremiobacteraeota bacterium]